MDFKALAFALVILPCACPALAGEIKEIDTYLASQAAEYLGSEYRPDVNRAWTFVQSGEDQTAWDALAPVLAFCDTKRSDADTRVVSVAGATEADEFRASVGSGVAVIFIDRACPSAYKAAGFLAVRAKDANAAFGYLEQAQQLAPYWAEPLAERAYLLGSLGDRAASLKTYRAAMVLAEKHPSSAYMKPLILRGIGYAQIELGDLHAAQRAYEASLELEPSSKLAKDELKYIEQARARQAASD